MRRHLAPWVLGSVLLLAPGARLVAGDGETVTRTGWIACHACSKGREGTANAHAPNRECSQKCIREGSPVVFYDEGTKALLRVENPDATKGQESHKVQITGTVDAAKKTVRVASVKVLEEYVASCKVDRSQ